MAQGIASFGWSGKSGTQIGFADQFPYRKYGPSFTADEVHAQKYDPNAPNIAALPGEIGEVPVFIQDDGSWYDHMEGANGWLLDNIHNPWHEDEPGTVGHANPIGPAQPVAQFRDLPDFTHGQDVYQLMPPANHGIDFYGKTIETAEEQYNWSSSTSTPFTTHTTPLDARYETANWPVPFDSNTVAGLVPVVRPTERIPMRRIAEDDRPVYRQIAIPGQNIAPSGSVYTPTFESNRVIHNVKPIPAMARTPTIPWTQSELSSPDIYDGSDTDVFSGMGF